MPGVEGVLKKIAIRILEKSRKVFPANRGARFVLVGRNIQGSNNHYAALFRGFILPGSQVPKFIANLKIDDFAAQGLEFICRQGFLGTQPPPSSNDAIRPAFNKSLFIF
jgi:hypothetical protein